jgi:DUF1680 family protein
MKLRLFSMCAFGAILIGHGAFAQSYVPELHDTRMKIKPQVEIKAYSFPLNDIRLLESPFKVAMEADAKYLLEIEPDRLLAGFMEHSGLKPKGKMYGGWESSGLAGHTLGHYLSACSMQYAATGNPEFLKRANYIVDQLDECQKSRKTGYIGTIPKEDSVWTEVASGHINSRGFDLNGAWSPWYTVHKIMAGLLDAYLYCHNTKALKIETGIADWTGNTIKNLDDQTMQKMLFCEYGGMTETLVNTYALTGNKKYLDLSYRFYDKRILDSLAAGDDVLPGKHSNTQIPKVIGSARRYELTNDKKDEDIAQYFWTTVTKYHSYATGGNSNYEYLGPPGKLNDLLTDNTTETCNTYNMLKLTRHLFTVNPSAGLMDFYEKALYNHILSSQNHDDGMMSYFTPLRMGGKKHFSNPFNTFTCCVGSGMENHVKYGESIYFQGSDGSLYVNLFIPSVLDWKEKGITIKQETKIPATNSSTFRVTTTKSQSLTIRIRKPVWAAGMKITINGKAYNASPAADGYIALNRKWINNDQIECTIPSDFYTEAMPDNANRRAIFYGPVLLAGTLGNTEPDPVRGTPVLVSNTNQISDWVRPVDASNLVFKTNKIGTPNDVQLIPFNEVKNEYYTVYWDVFTANEWVKQQKVYEAEKQKAIELESKTVDVLRIGEMQPERDHEFTGENTFTGENHGKKWRSSRGGSLSFKMNVAPNAQNSLMCTYWGMDNRGRIFDILVDGVKIATEDINKYKESRFYDINYPIPANLVGNKQRVTITMQPKPGNTVGPVYGLRMIKE